MGALTKVMEAELPGVYVHSIRIGENEDDDRNKGYFDVINRQVRDLSQHFCGKPVHFSFQLNITRRSTRLMRCANS